MSCLRFDTFFIQGNERIDLLIYIEVFDDTLSQEIIEVPETGVKLINVLLCHLRSALFNYN